MQEPPLPHYSYSSRLIRRSLGLFQQKLVKINAGLCIATYVAVILTIFLHCRPLTKHFQVYPDPGRMSPIQALRSKRS